MNEDLGWTDVFCEGILLQMSRAALLTRLAPQPRQPDSWTALRIGPPGRSHVEGPRVHSCRVFRGMHKVGREPVPNGAHYHHYQGPLDMWSDSGKFHDPLLPQVDSVSYHSFEACIHSRSAKHIEISGDSSGSSGSKILRRGADAWSQRSFWIDHFYFLLFFTSQIQRPSHLQYGSEAEDDKITCSVFDSVQRFRNANTRLKNGKTHVGLGGKERFYAGIYVKYSMNGPERIGETNRTGPIQRTKQTEILYVSFSTHRRAIEQGAILQVKYWKLRPKANAQSELSLVS